MCPDSRRIGIVPFADVEELDAIGPANRTGIADCCS
jgi:hypothetical protein